MGTTRKEPELVEVVTIDVSGGRRYGTSSELPVLIEAVQRGELD